MNVCVIHYKNKFIYQKLIIKLRKVYLALIKIQREITKKVIERSAYFFKSIYTLYKFLEQ